MGKSPAAKRPTNNMSSNSLRSEKSRDKAETLGSVSTRTATSPPAAALPERT
jgi:hypothetical protein